MELEKKMRFLKNFPWPLIELLVGFVFGSCFIVLFKPSQVILFTILIFIEGTSWRWNNLTQWNRVRAGFFLGVFVDAFKVGS